MRELICPHCRVGLQPTALFVSGGQTYWSAFPEAAARFDDACRHNEHPTGAVILGCRFMRQALDPWFLPDDDGTSAREVAGTDDSLQVVPQSVASLAAAHVQDGIDRDGIARIDVIAAAGQYVRRPPEFIGEMHVVQTQHAQQRQAKDSLVQSYAVIRRVIFRDATVSGQGTVVTRGAALVTDSCLELLAHGAVPPGLQADGPGRYRRSALPERTIEAPTLLLKRPWWRNYGHWLVDAAALLALLQERRIGGFEQIAIGIPEQPTSRAMVEETIALLAPGIPVLAHPDEEIWRFAELHYVQPVQIPQLFKLPAALAALRRGVLGGEADAAGHRRLFISRQHFPGRRLVNEARVIEVFQRHGFEVVFPETLSLLEQARLFMSASVVAGVKGAGLTNMVFCPPSAVMILLSPVDWPDLFFWDIAGQRDFPYYELTGALASATAVQGQNPFAIDLRQLDALLGVALATGPVSI